MKDEFGDAAAKLEKRAAEMRMGFRTQITDPMAELVLSLATFARAIGSASAAADRATRVIVWLTVVGVLVALTNAALVVVQISEADRAVNMQSSIALNGQLYHDPSREDELITLIFLAIRKDLLGKTKVTKDDLENLNPFNRG